MRFVCVVGLLLATVVASASQPRPNVLFIVCDDLNTHVSTSGYPDIQTPTFASFASDAMTFNRAFCQYPGAIKGVGHRNG